MKRVHSILLAIFGVSALLTMGSCKKDLPEDFKTIAEIKTVNWRDLIGDTVEVEGYFTLNEIGQGTLFFDKSDYKVNGLIDEARYLAMSGDNIRTLDPQDYFMDRIRIKGRIRETTDVGRRTFAYFAGDLVLCEFEPIEIPTIIEQSQEIAPDFSSPCIQNPQLCQLMNPTVSTKYALLYSGGINKDKAYQRYWNDMALYYNMLIWLRGFDPDNIIVVYKDGLAANNDMPVHYAATPSGLDQAFSALNQMMDNNDQFFLFMTNHGGSISDDNSPTPDDEDYGQDNTDECAFYYNISGVPYDDDFAEYVNSLPFESMTCVMEQCLSGGMLYDLRGPNRVIISAANEVESSYGGAKFDDFVMLFASALIGKQQETGATVDADTNNDGEVSMYEAFRWATDNDPHPEHPMYEDNGDGQGVLYPNMDGVIDGVYGSNVFL